MKNKFMSRIPWREKMDRPQEPKLVAVRWIKRRAERGASVVRRTLPPG